MKGLRVITVLLAIVMPGVAQIVNRHYLKGILFLILEHLINYFAHLNRAIYLDLNGFHTKALQTLSYDFALFYPGFFTLTIWDAFVYATSNPPSNKAAIFFLIGGFLGTVVVIYSRYVPFPLLSGGLSIIIPLLLGVIIFRNG